jgi:DNA-binding MarR family transcriptional regulator
MNGMMTIEQAQQLPGVLLWHTSKLWQQTLNRALATAQLSSTNAIILSNLLHLSLEHKQTTQAEIARLSGVDLMTTSTALRTLERKGFVARTASSTDKRANRVKLTPLGKKTAYTTLMIIAVTHQAFFKTLADNNSTQVFTGCLKELLEQNKFK